MSFMKTVIVLGSTGSIGKNTLNVISKIDGFKVVGLCSNTDIKRLVEQVYKYSPKCISVFDENANKEIRRILNKKVKVFPPGIFNLIFCFFCCGGRFA